MSDYDEWGRFMLTVSVVGFLTLPVWGGPYLIWWLVKGREEDRILKEKTAVQEKENLASAAKWLAEHPPKPKLTPEQLIENEKHIRDRLIS